MFKKSKYVFTDTFQTEAKVLAILKIIMGLICIGILSYYIYLYTTAPTIYKSGNFWPFIESNWNNQNIVARFLMWGADKHLLLVTIPYTDCIAMIGVLLLVGAHKRVLELLQVWIILSIIFCMVDLVLLLPAATFAQYKIVLLLAYIFSYMQKIYSFWIVKGILSELLEEKANDQESDPDFARRGSRRY